MKIEQTHIKTFAQLITYFEKPKVTVSEIQQILSEAKIVWIDTDESKDEILRRLKEFWANYPEPKERPLFL
jgi:hypothetical protein